MSKVTVVTVVRDKLRYIPGELVLQSPRSYAVRLSGPAEPTWQPGMEIAIVLHRDEPVAMLGLLKSMPSDDGIISITPFESLA